MTFRQSGTARNLCLVMLGCIFSFPLVDLCSAQTIVANATQQLTFAGLRSLQAKGQINALKTDQAGDLYLAFDQGDGVRILKVANKGGALLAQIYLGGIGDSAVALALDPDGNVYIAGTSTSGTLSASNSAAILSSAAGTTSSFVAKFDPELNQRFLTFTGGSRIAATTIAVTQTSVFVGGVTYATDLPVTGTAVMQAPSVGSAANGFVEAFGKDGSQLEYATYVTGQDGDTTIADITVDSTNAVWLVGSTSAPFFPTVAAIIPEPLSSPSGYIMQLSSAGDATLWSTFVPGDGLNSIKLDSSGRELLICGQVDLGLFPVDTVESLLVPTNYQVLLRLSLDGSKVFSGTVIAPGLASTLTAAANGDAWVGGAFPAGSAPLLPQDSLSTIGSAYAVRVKESSGLDQTVRFGGLPNGNQSYASLPVSLKGLAVDAFGVLFAGGSVMPSASSDLLQTETYDLPLLSETTSAFSTSLGTARPTDTTCGGSLCYGSAGYLVEVDPGSSAPALILSIDELPLITLRNLGTTVADNLRFTIDSGIITTTCEEHLNPGGSCDLLLAGGAAGTLIVSASNAASVTEVFSAYKEAKPLEALVFSPKELDFGVQSSASIPRLQTITIANLGSASQVFNEGLASTPKSNKPFTESSSDCASTPDNKMKVLAAGASCHVVVAFTASPDFATDGFALGEWTAGSGQVLVTGYAQAAALSVSAKEIDFGEGLQNGLMLPRYLYLSNASTSSVLHNPLSGALNPPFSVVDDCPSLISAGTVCRIRLDYLSAIAPSVDATTLSLDQGLTVLVSGTTAPPRGSPAGTFDPGVTVLPMNVDFILPVTVTGVSSETHTIQLTNFGLTTLPLSLAIIGDFVDTTTCRDTLPGGESCSVSAHFTPSQPGIRVGELDVSSGLGTTPIRVSLSGIGQAILPPNNGILTFPLTPIGQPSLRAYKIARPFDHLNFVLSGPFTATLVEDQGYGYGSPPNASYSAAGTGSCHDCWLVLKYLPSALDAQSGSLNLSSAPSGSPYRLSLAGQGELTSGLFLSPSTYNFETIPVGSTSETETAILTNLLPDALSITGINMAGDFALVPSVKSCSGTILSSASCSVDFLFSPIAEGTRSGSLTISTSAGPVTMALSGGGASETAISLSPIALNFDPTRTTQTVTLTNNNLAPVLVGSASVSTAGFAVSTTCGVLAPSAKCVMLVSFTPEDTPIFGNLTIPITSLDSAGEDKLSFFTVALAGNFTASEAALSAAPVSLAFGPFNTSTPGSTRSISISNLSAKSLTIAPIMPRDFALLASDCSSLAPDATCSLSVQFTPLANGLSPGTISIQGIPLDGSSAFETQAYVNGFGLGTGSLTVVNGQSGSGAYDFGGVLDGQSQSHTFTLTNDGLSELTVRRITSPPPFLTTSTCGSVLRKGASCALVVTYTPVNTHALPARNDAGVVTVESDSQSSPNLIDLSGLAEPNSQGSIPDILKTFTLSQGSLSFPAAQIGTTSPAQTVTFANTGNVPILVNAVTATSDFLITDTCDTVAPGSTCLIGVSSKPQTTGVHQAALEISSDATNSLDYVSLLSSGTLPVLGISPSSLSFGQVLLGESITLSVTVTNASLSPVLLQTISTSGDFDSGGSCPVSGATLAPQASCIIEVIFTPRALGLRKGVLSLVASSSASPMVVMLSGTGVRTSLLASPQELTFGKVLVGGSAALSVQLSNQGASTLSHISTAVGGDFQVTGCSNGTLEPSSSCLLQVNFVPLSAGSQMNTLSISSSDAFSPLLVPLNGTGIINPGINLSVNGEASATATLKSGTSATFSLVVSPEGGFLGDVDLACLPSGDVPDATCSLSSSHITLGTASQFQATIETEQNATGSDRRLQTSASSLGGDVILMLVPSILLLTRRTTRSARLFLQLFASIILCSSLLLNGCTSKSFAAKNYTPPGSYAFTVTASAKDGSLSSRAVTLNLEVTAR